MNVAVAAHFWNGMVIVAHAKSVVAGSLLDARSLLVKRAILFTGHNDQAAQAVYQGIFAYWR
ncbi:hypothetical protein [Nostoc sp.]|uniref:hypothetical protein n=1 Tax=Nostoc sp. TaxID=1180 RepID=UPI002FFBF3D3